MDKAEELEYLKELENMSSAMLEGLRRTEERFRTVNEGMNGALRPILPPARPPPPLDSGHARLSPPAQRVRRSSRGGEA